MEESVGQVLHSGDVIAERYVIEGLLGKGGMGEVYSARDGRLRRRVAIKTIDAVQSLSHVGRKRLRTEAETVARIGHPGIVTIYDVLEEEGRVLLVMEFVDGVSLREKIATASLPAHEVASVVTAVASALAAAHAVSRRRPPTARSRGALVPNRSRPKV